MQFFEELKIIWHYLKEYKRKIALVISVTLIGSLAGATIPLIYGRLVDMVNSRGLEPFLVFEMLAGWFGLILVSDWVRRFTERRGDSIGIKTSNNFLLEIVSHILNLPLKFHKEKKMGEVLERVSRASGYLENIITGVVFSTLPQFLMVAAALGMMFWIEWRLSLIVVLFLIAYGSASLWKMKPIIEANKRLNRTFEKSYGDLYDSTLNISVVKSSTNEDFEKKKNKRNFEKTISTYTSFLRLWTNLSAWQQTIFGAGFVIIFGTGLFLTKEKIITTGELITFFGYSNLVFGPFSMLAMNYRTIKRGMAAIKRALIFLRVKPEEYERRGLAELKEIKGEVVFSKVSFGYRDHQLVLEDINFKARPGEVIALVGESGGGKTTLCELISRYYTPRKGRVFIDDQDIRKVGLKSLRANIAIVPQEVTLFNDTIRNNIRYGRMNATDKEIVKVAKAANAHQFIKSFPKGYRQVVGERGIKLSTGQKQRVAIARALLRDPRILILDEATSSLDSVSEKLVQGALKRLIEGRTTFVIAHRLSTIAKADKILVLDKGRIVERGTHGQLMKKKGIYHNLYSLQSAFVE